MLIINWNCDIKINLFFNLFNSKNIKNDIKIFIKIFFKWYKQEKIYKK